MAVGVRRLIFTGDGSHSVVEEDTGITYHSRHGAIQESRHVFIEAGLHAAQSTFPADTLSVFEMGFGTGLNAFLTAIEALGRQPVRYVALDAYPLELGTIILLNYPEQLGHEDLFNAIQLAPWNALAPIHNAFSLQKQAAGLLDYACGQRFHLIYFDAFAPEAQPELWTEAVFKKLGACMYPGGLLVTYCSKAAVRRALEAAGWQVEKLPGPAGKREMARARWTDGA